MDDKSLVEMLCKPPKTVPMLRTKSSFQEFFRGIAAGRMRQLLEQAYGNLADEAERHEKVAKRMELLKEILA
jgi:hypothetical protein